MKSTENSINKEILRLAGPNILSNLSVPLLSSVDTFLMGSLSDAHIAAVGIGSMIFNFLYWNFAFLRMGTTGFTAQAFGAQDGEGIKNGLIRALLVALFVAIGMYLLRKPLCEAAYYLLAIPEEQQSMVGTYFFIRILALPATMSLYAFMGWFFGMQNALFPLWVTIFINVLNMLVSIVLVRQEGMEVAGVAWGTVAAQYAGLCMAIGLVAYRYRSYFLAPFSQSLWEASAFRRFFTVNSNIFLRTICLTIAYGFFYSRSSAQGVTVLAANTLLYQFVIWMSYGIDGFAFAAESLVGKYKGALNDRRLRKVVSLTFRWGAAIALAMTLVYALTGHYFIEFFTNDQSLVKTARIYLIWAVLLPVFSFASFIWDGVFVGLTASRSMRNAMFLALALFLLSYQLLSAYGNHALWLTFTIYMAARGVIQWWLYRRAKSVFELR